MKIALAQINPRVGDVSHNLSLILDHIDQSKKQGCQLVVFPELSILGYPPRDLINYSHVIRENLSALDTIRKHSENITVIVGYVEPNSQSVGKPFHNSAAVFQNGKQIGNYRKWLLPYYDVFEEERYFQPGDEILVCEIQGKKVGLTICEDLWNGSPLIQRKYAVNPVEQYVDIGLDLLVNISASPFEIGKKEIREQVFQSVSKKLEVPVAFCNQVGANDELIFDGGSFVVSPSGKTVQAKSFFPDLVFWTLTPSAQRIKEEPKTESQLLLEALVLGIKDYVLKTPVKTVCLGLSGGIDSSVVAALAVKALGPDRVFGYALPSRFNLSASLEDAKQLASNLGINFKTLSIEPAFDAFSQVLAETLEGSPKTLTLENVQPRIRMTLLMALANEYGHILLNTSNKSEISAGYATLYGDTAGALAVLGDLTKHQVYALAKEINSQAKKEIIPQRVMTRAPSAELRDNQTDQDTLPPYDILDFIVEEHIEKGFSLNDISGHGMTQGDLTKFAQMNSISEYKRRQSPPILRVTSKAFGVGRRIPVVGRKPAQ